MNRDNWLILSNDDFESFANAKRQIKDKAAAEKSNWIGGKVFAAIAAAAAMVFTPISLPVVGGLWLAVEAFAFVSNNKSDELKEIEEKVKQEQEEAKALKQEVAQVILKLNPAKS